MPTNEETTSRPLECESCHSTARSRRKTRRSGTPDVEQAVERMLYAVACRVVTAYAHHASVDWTVAGVMEMLRTALPDRAERAALLVASRAVSRYPRPREPITDVSVDGLSVCHVARSRPRGRYVIEWFIPGHGWLTWRRYSTQRARDEALALFRRGGGWLHGIARTRTLRSATRP